MPASRVRAPAPSLPRLRGEIARALPSGRSLLVGLALFLGAAAAFFAARESSLFAVRDIEVRGAPPAVRAQVVKALRQERGVSLLRIDGGVVDQRLAVVPAVASARYDRSFPNTLVVIVRTERPVAVVRRGSESWLVSARGRVLEKLARGARPELPRVWVSRKASIATGATLTDDAGGRAARALAPLAQVRFPADVAVVAASQDRLTFKLRSGLELRFGGPGDLRLKLAIARRIMRGAGPVAAGDYLDVSVPERPVAFLESQVEG
ncbi:MAG TPA: FtsQ-type POTRA domain-containing protein [Gaiellaceae bacterium]|nr:FtsQ-type POTRA domain-containing protein [Gaiellaceae bacterium]